VDLSKTLQELYAEKERLEQSIALLEEFQRSRSGGEAAAAPARKRRGRKTMGPEERRLVSMRMRAYWAGRRQPTT
jgi:hypothetical protein